MENKPTPCVSHLSFLLTQVEVEVELEGVAHDDEASNRSEEDDLDGSFCDRFFFSLLWLQRCVERWGRITTKIIVKARSNLFGVFLEVARRRICNILLLDISF